MHHITPHHRTVQARRLAAVCFSLLLLTALSVATPRTARAEHWSRWRGPDGTGHTTETGLPLEWDASSVTWQTDLPGLGHSSPIVWGNMAYLTAAEEGGKQRIVLAVDRTDGRIVWQQVAWTGKPESSHRMNGFATPSCCTDGERVYAWFGSGGGLFCYSAAGKLLWSSDLGQQDNRWGAASSPILAGDLVIQLCDADTDAFIVALNRRTGEEVWRKSRDNYRGWSTPILFEHGGLRELIVNGHSGVRSYSPETGDEYWFCRSFRGRGTPTITPSATLLHAVNGTPGDMYAIRPGGSGDITKSHMAWHVPRRGGRDLPSPLVIDDLLLIVSMKGVLTCTRPETGEELWKDRLGGNYSASPVAVQGRALFLAEDGVTSVVRPAGDQLIVERKNALPAADDELFRACITPANGQLLIRSDRRLYAIGTFKAPAGE